FHLPNAADAEYAEWEFSARPGHQSTVYTRYRVEVADGAVEVCLDDYADAQPQFAGVLPVPQQPRVRRQALAPENAAIAHPLPARGPVQARIHYFNVTTTPMLRESWLNLYFPREPANEQTRPAQLTAGITWQLEPGEEKSVTFTCPITGSGRLL